MTSFRISWRPWRPYYRVLWYIPGNLWGSFWYHVDDTSPYGPSRFNTRKEADGFVKKMEELFK